MGPFSVYALYQVLHVQPVEQTSMLVERVFVKIAQVHGGIVNLHMDGSLLLNSCGYCTKIHVAGACHVALAEQASVGKNVVSTWFEQGGNSKMFRSGPDQGPSVA